MLASVHSAGSAPRLMAAFSAGRPNESQPDRVQDVVPLLDPVASDHVGQPPRLGMAHVQVARRVREHVQQVATLSAAVVAGLERVQLVPDLQPLLLHGRDVVRRPWLFMLLSHRSYLLAGIACSCRMVVRRLRSIGALGPLAVSLEATCRRRGQGTKKPLMARGSRAGDDLRPARLSKQEDLTHTSRVPQVGVGPRVD